MGMNRIVPEPPGVEELCAERVLAESTTTEQTAVWNYGIKALRESGQGFASDRRHRRWEQVHGLIAVYGPKGGTGKTFVAVNLAVVLAERAKGGVVLVDLDLTGGDVAVHLNLMGGPTLAEAVGALEELGGEIASTLFGTRADLMRYWHHGRKSPI